MLQVLYNLHCYITSYAVVVYYITNLHLVELRFGELHHETLHYILKLYYMLVLLVC